MIKAEFDVIIVGAGISGIKSFSARFIVFGTRYYDYDRPLQAEIPG